MVEAPHTEDTIVAAATPPGKGGIGIVRLSGPLTGRIATKMLGALPKPRVATHCEFRAADRRIIDSGIALYFPRPASFTGESVLELHGHGGPMLQAMLVDAAIAAGARRAEPGEFSKRAFLNGKLDLVQAEAIADLIDSGTAQAARAAQRSLAGAFSRAVDALGEKLTGLRLHVEAAIDFPEEEIDFLSDRALAARVTDCDEAFARLESETRVGRVLRDGYRVVIVGRPNAGKSSLMNVLSGQDAAIVTAVAGTTRDILREQIDIDGLAVELVDTAGLREDPDVVEAEGIRRARNAMASADAVLFVTEAGDGVRENPDAVLPAGGLPEGIPIVTLLNKTDLTAAPAGIVSRDPPVLRVSAKTGDGIRALRDTLRDLAGYRDLGEGAFTARRRHVEALAVARQHFERGRQRLERERAGELFAEELRLAQVALGEITGEVSADDLLGRIFSEFCIGK